MLCKQLQIERQKCDWLPLSFDESASIFNSCTSCIVLRLLNKYLILLDYSVILSTSCCLQIEKIVGKHGLVVISRVGSNPESFIYESDVLTKHKVSNC